MAATRAAVHPPVGPACWPATAVPIYHGGGGAAPEPAAPELLAAKALSIGYLNANASASATVDATGADLLVVLVAWSAVVAAPSVTFHGDALSEVSGSLTENGAGRCALYTLADPFQGSADLTVTAANALTASTVAGAFLFAGAGGINADVTSVDGTTVTSTLTGVAADSALAGAAIQMFGTLETPSVSSGWTSQEVASQSTTSRITTYGHAAAAGSVSITSTWAGWAYQFNCLIEATAG